MYSTSLFSLIFVWMRWRIFFSLENPIGQWLIRKIFKLRVWNVSLLSLCIQSYNCNNMGAHICSKNRARMNRKEKGKNTYSLCTYTNNVCKQLWSCASHWTSTWETFWNGFGKIISWECTNIKIGMRIVYRTHISASNEKKTYTFYRKRKL